MARYAVEVKNLNRTFTTKAVRGKSKKEIVKALNDVNLTINEGELFGLLGPNGAGKTTLIKILCTLLLPSSGEARVLGHDVHKDTNAIRQKINMVSGGETSGYGLLTVRENIWLFSQLYGIPSKEANRRIDMLMKELKLEHKKNSKVRTLSTGLRQKANMVRGFMTDPALIFLDEPTLGLDVNASRLIRDFIKNWIREKPSRTVLLTTHYMVEADELCDRVAIINDGRVLACDTPDNLKKLIHQDSVLKLEIRQVDNVTAFENIAGVRNFTHSNDMASGITRLKFILDDEAIVADIVAAVPKSGSKILSVQKTEPTLEDVFVALVGRGLTNHEV
ncbi:MAG: ABC transporter ATP-binding protein [Candidatus Thermoplasmatota archaeon]|nr:ABC transporter ATP-binding protein [Euryarchaeota archaeon]MBU4031798.1 ABC transporter ATP-binding protein [Candidatus Thermoplasmatota archaeon]MBU4071781.1 ABC transporter ATP-binding protein [Candidatus Thermoplasmatota archaeon]MBU4143908.1 ABC transporter ATP-binding protein [Candidatus Thermoplasmatota archaeon]MBU4592483.1 ABC transporter ATP-binding protein [Candidatus Thermoplasmatota archaeon]